MVLIDANEATLPIPRTKRAHRLRSSQRPPQLDGRNLPVQRENSPSSCLFAAKLTAKYSSANRARTRSVSVEAIDVDSMDTETDELDEESSEEGAPKYKAPKRYVAVSSNQTPCCSRLYVPTARTHAHTALTGESKSRRRRPKKSMRISN